MWNTGCTVVGSLYIVLFLFVCFFPANYSGQDMRWLGEVIELTLIATDSIWGGAGRQNNAWGGVVICRSQRTSGKENGWMDFFKLGVLLKCYNYFQYFIVNFLDILIIRRLGNNAVIMEWKIFTYKLISYTAANIHLNLIRSSSIYKIVKRYIERWSCAMWPSFCKPKVK